MYTFPYGRRIENSHGSCAERYVSSFLHDCDVDFCDVVSGRRWGYRIVADGTFVRSKYGFVDAYRVSKTFLERKPSSSFTLHPNPKYGSQPLVAIYNIRFLSALTTICLWNSYSMCVCVFPKTISENKTS